MLEILILVIVKEINIRFINYLKVILSFIVLTALFNYFLGDINIMILTTSRLIVVCLLTYIISKILSVNKISKGITNLLYPLRIFKIDLEELEITISIALSLIPILSNEAKQIKLSLSSKGFNFNFKNVITRPHIFVITYTQSIFRKIDELELSLLAKGYE